MATTPLRRGQQHHHDDGEVRRVVEIIVGIVARHTVAIIVDNGKTPTHWQWQQRHRDKGNNTIVTTAETPVHQQQ